MWHKKMRLGIGFFLFLLTLFAGYKSASCGRVVGEDIFVDKLDAAPPPTTPTSLSRSNFPAEFIFGTSSSAYQFEGAANEGGRGPSIWDTFVRKYPDKIRDHSTGKVATDSYHRYKEDVKEMKEMGFDAYRFSISWSRLLPSGKLSAGVNPEGLQYYNNLINELLANGLKPFVTLFHWDLPQALQDEYGGFLSPQIAKDFGDYAELCFREFGDRVKHWITVNEPFLFTMTGYANGTFAPGRCSDCPEGGDSATEPYTVAHHLLLAHATAVKIYRAKYQTSQKGEIGLVLDVLWTVPLYNSTADKMAASRALAFMYDWFMEPLHSGSYPIEMVKYVAERLPQFTKEESFLIKGSFDFIGINYYSATYVTNTPCQVHRSNYLADSCVALTDDRSGIPIGPRAASFWLYVYPEGIQEVLLYTKEKFGDPVLYITENGVDEANDGTFSLQDDFRIDYHAAHLNYVRNAIKKGANVKGYFVWSLLDNFEWADGYTVRFGLIYVDFNNGLKRYPKKSANWFKWFLRHRQLSDL